MLLFYTETGFRNSVMEHNMMKMERQSEAQGIWFLTGLHGKRTEKDIPKIHPAQKPVETLKDLINVFTDPGDVVIDPCAGSGSTLRAAHELGRNAFGFEIDRIFYNRAKEEMLNFTNTQMTLAL